MANIRKSFNFRSGLQVDNDNFVINSNGLVGIGTSVPSGYLLNVYGDTRITGLTTANNIFLSGGLNVSGVTTVGFITASTLDVSGDANITGVLTTSQLQVGSSEVVDNLIGYARTTFITDNGGVGLHTTSKIGINTTTSPGASDEELNVFGDLKVTGLTTSNTLFVTEVATASTFSGSGAQLTDIPNSATTASDSSLANTIVSRDSNADFSANFITANSFVGTSSLAEGLTGNPAIDVVSVNSTGIVTSSTRVITPSIGVGTESPNSDIHIRKSSGIASLQVTSDTDYSIITLGESVTLGSDNGQIRYGYGNDLGDAEFSTEESLDVINYGTGNLNFYLDPSGFGNDFNWLTNASTRAMVLTQSGNLGINSTSPSERLSVGGGVTVTGNLYANGDITGNSFIKTGGTSSEFLKADGTVDSSTYITSSTLNIVDDTTPQLGGNLDLNNNSIQGTGDMNFTGDITCNNASVGVITSFDGFTSGTGGPVEISVVGTTLTFNVVGVGSISLTLS